MKSLDKYFFNEKMKKTGHFVWETLVITSSLAVLMFIIVTCVVFWQNITTNLLFQGINITKQVGQMFLIVAICIVILVINKIKNLSIKNEN